MKRTVFILAIACLVSLTGCEKKVKEDLGTLILGKWDLTGLEQAADTRSIVIGNETVSVVLSILPEDHLFYLEQQLGSGRTETFFGKWTLNGKILSGEYSDKTPWGQSYEAEVEGHDLLLLKTENGKEVYRYQRLP